MKRRARSRQIFRKASLGLSPCNAVNYASFREADHDVSSSARRRRPRTCSSAGEEA